MRGAEQATIQIELEESWRGSAGQACTNAVTRSGMTTRQLTSSRGTDLRCVAAMAYRSPMETAAPANAIAVLSAYRALVSTVPDTERLVWRAGYIGEQGFKMKVSQLQGPFASPTTLNSPRR